MEKELFNLLELDFILDYVFIINNIKVGVFVICVIKFFKWCLNKFSGQVIEKDVKVLLEKKLNSILGELWLWMGDFKIKFL